MPSKTIYVAEEDLSVIARADAELEGSLSSNVVAGLRGLLERQDAARKGFTEVVVTVEEDGMKRELAFQGRCVARNEQFTEGGKVHEERRIYATVGGRFAYYTRVGANWNYWSDGRNWDDATSLEGYPQTRTLTVVNALDELVGVADAGLVAAAGTNHAKPAREYLDI